MPVSTDDRLARIEAMLELLCAAQAGTPANPSEPDEPAPIIDPELMWIGEAAAQMGRSKDSLRKIAHRAGIGRSVGGRLYVPRDALRAVLASGKKGR